jgi:hypothetical protein
VAGFVPGRALRSANELRRSTQSVEVEHQLFERHDRRRFMVRRAMKVLASGARSSLEPSRIGSRRGTRRGRGPWGRRASRPTSRTMRGARSSPQRLASSRERATPDTSARASPRFAIHSNSQLTPSAVPSWYFDTLTNRHPRVRSPGWAKRGHAGSHQASGTTPASSRGGHGTVAGALGAGGGMRTITYRDGPEQPTMTSATQARAHRAFAAFVGREAHHRIGREYPRVATSGVSHGRSTLLSPFLPRLCTPSSSSAEKNRVS